MANKNFEISPSILSANFTNLDQNLHALKSAGIKKIHLDVMDGHFVPNISFGMPVIESLTKAHDFIWDAHLMIENPDFYIKAFKKVGVHHITVHVETCPHLHRTIQLIKEYEMTAGVAYNPATSIVGLEYILEELDLVLVMSVNPGFGGQSFISSQLDKIRAIRAQIDTFDKSIVLQVDGGINERTYHKILNAGATDLVMGSAIFNQNPMMIKSYIENLYAR